MKLIFDLPGWAVALFIPLSLLAGAGYALLLYYRDRRLKEVKKAAVRAMAAFRFVAVSLLCFLLLAPMVKMETSYTEKPVIIIAQDNSESVLGTKDSLYYQNEYVSQLNAAISSLKENYEVVTYNFGDHVTNEISHSFSDKQTDISEFFDEIYARHYNTNVGAIILATDGLYNRGLDPVYSSKSLSGVPVFPIALGDTNIRKDIMVNEVVYNRLAYLNNLFPMQIIVEANKLSGNSTKLTVTRGGEVMYSEDILIDNDGFAHVSDVLLEADRVGLQRYTVSISEIEGEVTLANNSYDVYIDILDSRQKILILANSPHPDISAIKESIKANSSYEVTAKLIEDFDGNVLPYSLVILHQIPSRRYTSEDVIQQLFDNQIPTLFMFGAQTKYDQANQLKLGVQVIGYRGSIDERKGSVNELFTLFNINDDLKSAIPSFPPLHVPFADYKSGAGVNVLFFQKKGTIVTNVPLISFSEVNNTKIGVIAGEGIWRWRTHNYNRTGSHDQYDELVSKIIQYMAAKEDKSYFRVFSKNTFLENQPVIIEAEVYNEAYELINEPEVSITIVGEDKKEYPFSFNKTTNAYRLNAGLLPPGNYAYRARVTTDGKEFTETGEFSIKKLQVEFKQVVANHQVLYRMASESGGELLYPNQLAELPEIINNAKQVVEIAYKRNELSDLLNYKLICFIVLLLLAAEWFMRKYNGAY